jgi:hypothetical protein
MHQSCCFLGAVGHWQLAISRLRELPAAELMEQHLGLRKEPTKEFPSSRRRPEQSEAVRNSPVD